MSFAAFLPITLAPVLMVLLIRYRIHPESTNPVNRLMIARYAPAVRVVLRFKMTKMALAITVLSVTVPVFCAWGRSSCCLSTRVWSLIRRQRRLGFTDRPRWRRLVFCRSQR